MALGKIALYIYSIFTLIARFANRIYYQSITVVNSKNVSSEGPYIIYANHSNQLNDGAIVAASLPTIVVRNIVSAKQMRLKGVGLFAKGISSIPCERAQDVEEVLGQGVITKIEEKTVTGKGTMFTKLNKGTIISLEESKKKVTIVNMISDTKAQIAEETQIFIPQNGETFRYQLKPCYDDMYEEVWKCLADRQSILIFPEGGSHDLWKMRPLKAGVCIMALGAALKYGVQAKLVSCALHYEHSDRFRSKVVIQFGQPETVSARLMQLYSVNKKEGTSELLSSIEQRLKERVLQFEPYEELDNLKMLFQLLDEVYPGQQMRRTLKIKRKLAQQYELKVRGEKNKELQAKITEFRKLIEDKGLSLKAVPQTKGFNVWIFVGLRASFWFLLMLPGLVMYYPAAWMVKTLAELFRQKVIRQRGKSESFLHVVSSYRIMIGIAVFPTFLFFMSFVLYWLFSEHKFFLLGGEFSITWLLLLAFFLLPFHALIWVKFLDHFCCQWSILQELWLARWHPEIHSQYLKTRGELQEWMIEIGKNLAK